MAELLHRWIALDCTGVPDEVASECICVSVSVCLHLLPLNAHRPTLFTLLPSLSALSLCVCEDGVGFIPALHLFSPPQWLYHRGEKCCFTEEGKWGVWLCPPGSQRWDTQTQTHICQSLHWLPVFRVCENSDLRSSLLIWVTECGSACTVTESTARPALVNTQFVYSDALRLLCVSVCVCVSVWVHVSPLVASSLAELSASCPICSSHMVFSFSRDTVLAPLLSSSLCLFLFLFLSALLHLLHILSVHYPLKIFYVITFIPSTCQLKSPLYSSPSNSFHSCTCQLPAWLVTTATHLRNLARNLSVLHRLHHSLPWFLGHRALFYSPAALNAHTAVHLVVLRELSCVSGLAGCAPRLSGVCGST